MRVAKTLLMLGFDVPRLAFARTCSERGAKVYVIDVAEKARSFRRYSSAIETIGRVITREQIGRPKGLEIIHDFARSVGADALVTTHEPALIWLAANRKLFEPDCTIMAADACVLEALLYKDNQAELARRAGFCVLPSWLLYGHTDNVQIPLTEYPLCLRPTYSNSAKWNFKAKVVNCPAEMIEFLSSVSITSPLIAQPFRNGPNLVVHGVRSLDGRILAMSAFVAYRKFRGLALSLRPITLPAEVEASCRRFAAIAGVVGAFHYDLVQSTAKDTTYFLEMNARMGGTMAKVIQLGFDEPSLALRSFGRELPLNARRRLKRTSVTGKRTHVKFIAANLVGDPCELSYPRQRRIFNVAQSLFEILTAHDEVLSASDIRGSLWYTLPHHWSSRLL